MNETGPLEKQDITPLYYKLNRIIILLEKLLEALEEKGLND